MFSDGEDTSSRIGFKTVLERARDEEVMVYSIGLESEYFNGMRVVRSRPSRDLRKIADETGGGYFELTKTADLAPTFTGAAQPVPDWLRAGVARRQGPQARSESEQAGHDGAGAQELSRGTRQAELLSGPGVSPARAGRRLRRPESWPREARR
jgi:hypothetical protein